MKELELWGFEVNVSKKRFTLNTLFMVLNLSARDFGSTRIPIEVSFRAGRGNEAVLYSPYPDIPDFEVLAQDINDMINDKIQAIIHRNKPRDLFDLYFLIKRHKVTIRWDKNELEKRINEFEELWDSLEAIVVRKLPSFHEVKMTILENCEE